MGKVADFQTYFVNWLARYDSFSRIFFLDPMRPALDHPYLYIYVLTEHWKECFHNLETFCILSENLFWVFISCFAFSFLLFGGFKILCFSSFRVTVVKKQKNCSWHLLKQEYNFVSIFVSLTTNCQIWFRISFYFLWKREQKTRSENTNKHHQIVKLLMITIIRIIIFVGVAYKCKNTTLLKLIVGLT